VISCRKTFREGSMASTTSYSREALIERARTLAPVLR
jgi:hypothetical protein